MSKNETTFIKVFASLAAALMLASIIGLVGMYQTSGIVFEKVKANETKIIELKNYHEKDLNLIRTTIKEIRSDQKIIMSDLKAILIKIQ